MQNTRPVAIFAIICCSIAVSLLAADKPPKVSTKDSFRPNNFRKVAVLVSGPNKADRYFSQPQSDQQRLVEDAFLGTLIEKNYEVAVRSDLEQLLNEQLLQKSGLTDSDSVQLGKLLNVSAVMVVHISELTLGAGPTRLPGKGAVDNLRLATVSLGARLIDVSTGSVLWTGTHRVELQVVGQRATDAIVKCAEELVDVFPKREASNEPEHLKVSSDTAERGRRLNAALVTGSVWEGTYSNGDERSIEVTWTIREREGTKFIADVVFPNRKQEISGTLSGGNVSWTQKGDGGKLGSEQSLKIRGDSISGNLKRNRANGDGPDFKVILTRKR